jgi:hypothetical protein
MMDRPNQYVVVDAALWDKYQRSHGVERKLLHVRIFYTEQLPRPGCCERGVYVLHPMLEGRIPDRYAVTERYYRDETRNAHRSEREHDRTQSYLRRLALA